MEIVALALALIVDISYGCRLARPCLKHKAYKHTFSSKQDPHWDYIEQKDIGAIDFVII